MGTCQSAEEKQLAMKSKAIDKDMMQSHLSQQKVVKLLLLGAGECGKSTVLKQMRILHDHGFTEEEALQQKGVVYNNTVQAMATVLRALPQLSLQFSDPAREADARIVLDVLKAGQEDACNRGNEFQLTESAPYFLDNLERISMPDYKPSEQDILLSRIKTTGIVEVKFQMKNVDFR
ncbi:unnamed protein product, partial [Mesorhabditis spiculigera]